MSHNRFGRILEPKPYAFVPFPERTLRQEVAGHDQLDLDKRYSGCLVYHFRALTPVFVSTGSYALGEDTEFPQEKVIRPFYRVNGKVTIPGSSIKGMARSIVEAVSPSCITITVVDQSKLPHGVDRANARGNPCTATHSCPACSIFGRMDQLGKACFGDAQPIGEIETALFGLRALYSPQARRTPPVYLNEAEQFEGRKFYFHGQPSEDLDRSPVEVMPEGTRVCGEVHFENLSLAELGLLFFALGLDGTLTPKLGAGKPLGLGSLLPIGATLSLLQPNHYLEAQSQEIEYHGEEFIQFVWQATRTALKGELLLREQAVALAGILKYDPERDAPRGAY